MLSRAPLPDAVISLTDGSSLALIREMDAATVECRSSEAKNHQPEGGNDVTSCETLWFVRHMQITNDLDRRPGTSSVHGQRTRLQLGNVVPIWTRTQTIQPLTSQNRRVPIMAGPLPPAVSPCEQHQRVKVCVFPAESPNPNSPT